MAGSGVWANPNILFYVSDRAPFEGEDPQRLLEEQLDDLHIAQRRRRGLVSVTKPGVVRTSSDGRNVEREHVIMARL